MRMKMATFGIKLVILMFLLLIPITLLSNDIYWTNKAWSNTRWNKESKNRQKRSLSSVPRLKLNEAEFSYEAFINKINILGDWPATNIATIRERVNQKMATLHPYYRDGPPYNHCPNCYNSAQRDLFISSGPDSYLKNEFVEPWELEKFSWTNEFTYRLMQLPNCQDQIVSTPVDGATERMPDFKISFPHIGNRWNPPITDFRQANIYCVYMFYNGNLFVEYLNEFDPEGKVDRQFVKLISIGEGSELYDAFNRNKENLQVNQDYLQRKECKWITYPRLLYPGDAVMRRSFDQNTCKQYFYVKKWLIPLKDIWRTPRHKPPYYVNYVWNAARHIMPEAGSSIFWILDNYGPPIDIIVMPPFMHPEGAPESVRSIIRFNIDLLVDQDFGLITNNIELLNQDFELLSNFLSSSSVEQINAQEKDYIEKLKGIISMLLIDNSEYLVMLKTLELKYLDHSIDEDETDKDNDEYEDQ